jgi:hypothetical protein
MHLHLCFVPIFVYIINVFMFVFWVIYALTLKFCTYVLFTFSMILCFFFGSYMDLQLSFVPIFLYIINNFYVIFWVTYLTYT